MFSRRLSPAFAVGCVFVWGVLNVQAQVVGTWANGVTASWSVTGAGGWTNGVVPNAPGDIASYDTSGNSSATTTQNTGAAVTVGTILVQGTADRSWIITNTNGINLNQDGPGPGRATISNTVTSAAPGVNSMVRLAFAAGGVVTLQDDLQITNTSNSARALLANGTGGGIQMQSPIFGTGNIFISSVTNTPLAGSVSFSAQGAYGGNTTVQKGAVALTRGDVFGPVFSNVVTIGSPGGGDATVVQTGNGGGFTMENNFQTAAGSGGALVFGSVGTPTSNLVMHGAFTLNDNLTITAGTQATTTIPLTIDLQYTISGPGGLTKTGTGNLLISTSYTGPLPPPTPNTYAGGTTVRGGTVTVSGIGRLGTGNVTVETTATSLTLLTTGLSDVIADTATLSLAGGGTPGVADAGFIDLSSGANETVGGLILAGVSQLPGVYTSATSPEFILGSGTITVAGVPEPGTLGLAGLAAAGLAVRRACRRRFTACV
jgi:PEP-CTERM motif